MAPPVFSVVVPAFDEERYLPACLDAVAAAVARAAVPVEVIVADNMSRDRTAAIARERGARVVPVEEKCLAIIRNRGAAAATGRYLVFVDADSIMSDNMLEAILKVMESGRYIGGGVANSRPDRLSLGILLSGLSLVPIVLWYGISGILFYTTREAFAAIGGFDETLYAVEDVDFARRLRRLGKERGLRFKHLFRAHVVTSARKFDEFGDWYFFRHPSVALRAFRNDRDTAHELWYRPRR